MHERITKSADSLRKIIRTILLHSKDRALFHNEPVDINGLIEDEMEFFKLNSTFKNKVEKKINLDKSLPAVYGSSIQIKQILDNLVKNAIDAMEDTKQKILTIVTSRDDNWVSIEISDTGMGIEKKHLERIFLPDYSTKPHDKGTGLGLASVRSMASAYDGDVCVASTPGKGTTFTVRLPAYHPEEEEATEPDPS
jgi:signal transduction histidine kinase